MKTAPIVFGGVAFAVGLGTGWLILTHPEGLDPSWPLGVALLAPAAFALGGLLLLGRGLGYPRFSAAASGAIVVCFLAIANWAAFFTARVPCRETVSLFGVPLLARYPSDIECRTRFRTIMGSVDAAVVLFFLAFARWRMRVRTARANAEVD